jgi:uncharacterized damage-inducible protein DinB
VATSDTDGTIISGMASLLRDLYEHQEWADSEHWRTIEANPAAASDRAVFDRLHHIHLVQHAFRWITGGRSSPFTITKPDEFASIGALKAYGRDAHNSFRSFLATVSPHLEERIDVPWFKDPPLSLTVQEALTQCAMHSQWHRGQNATRLRELGVEPPPVDLIVWYWKGRPASRWSADAE